MGISDIRARIGLRALVSANAARFILQRRPSGYMRSLRTGHDPVRVLVFGAGIALGYGVRTVEQSLNGKLAELLAAQLGRGVTVETIAAPALPLARSVRHLGLNGAHTFRAVVFTPGLMEMMHGETKRWRAQLEGLVEHLRQTGGPDVRIVLTGLPRPRGEFGRTEAAHLAKVDATNAVMAAVAAELPFMSFAPVPRVTNIRGLRPFDEAYYARCAESIISVLVPMLASSRDGIPS